MSKRTRRSKLKRSATERQDVIDAAIDFGMALGTPRAEKALAALDATIRQVQTPAPPAPHTYRPVPRVTLPRTYAGVLAAIEALRTPPHGWTRKSLASLGVPWPPPKGWRTKLLGDAKAAEKDDAEKVKRLLPQKPRRIPADGRSFEEIAAAVRTRLAR